MRRLCIYLTYDNQKIVDPYIFYMLKELKTCADTLIVVCNETDIVRGEELLSQYADAIFCRENKGFDAGGFKDVLCTYIGWNTVLQYEELALVNDSLFGPFCPMQDIFLQMEEQSVDFWGLSKHGEANTHILGHFTEHVQSFFLVIRSRLLHSKEFQEYWEALPYFETFLETVRGFEIWFTQYFSGLGYRYGTLADTQCNDSLRIANNFSQYDLLPYEMIKKRNFSFFKRPHLTRPILEQQTQEQLLQAMEYIGQETEYDVNLIWDHLIRTSPMIELQRTFCLRYLVPPVSGQRETTEGSITVLVFITCGKSAEYVMEHLQGLQGQAICSERKSAGRDDFGQDGSELHFGLRSESSSIRYLKGNISVQIFSETSEYLNPYQEAGFPCRVYQKENLIEVLTGFDKFDLVCVLQDTDMTSDVSPSYVGKSLFYNKWENLLKNWNHVRGIQTLFAENSRLGLLMPPEPGFGDYFGEYAKGRDGNYEKVCRILQELDIQVPISRQYAPVSVSDCFWIRGSILRKMKSGNVWKQKDIWNVETEKYLPYLWSYLAQDAGYYSAIVESLQYAAMRETNLQNYLQQIAAQVREQCGEFQTFAEMKTLLSVSAMKMFCQKYSRIFVYGTGGVAKRYREMLPKIEAYVVSDGQDKEEDIEGIAVKYLSELDLTEECGLVVCMDERNRMQVLPMLEARGVTNYFCVWE
jgi:lipopolysaccharide biosynthesis protein